MAAKKQNLVILQGETFQRVIRWEVLPYVYKAISAITQTAPVAITATAHGMASGWRAAVLSVKGMTEINAKHSIPRESEFHQVSVSGANTLTINDINSSEYSLYTSGGYLQYFTPVDIAGYSARMTIKDRVGGTTLMSLTNGAPDNRIVLDNTNHTITITIAAADTPASLLTWTKGVYDLEMVSGAGTVTRIFTGSVSVLKEVTT